MNRVDVRLDYRISSQILKNLFLFLSILFQDLGCVGVSMLHEMKPFIKELTQMILYRVGTQTCLRVDMVSMQIRAIIAQILFAFEAKVISYYFLLNTHLEAAHAVVSVY